MNASKRSIEIDEVVSLAVETPLDPFAVDFFGVKPAPLEETNAAAVGKSRRTNKKQAKALEEKPVWYKDLPQLTRRDLEFSAALQNLPRDITEIAAEKISEAIARYTFRQSENVDCSIISVAETDLNESIRRLSRSPQVFLTLGCQPDNAGAVVALDTDFAAAVIGLILEGKVSDPANTRNLSPIEHAIIEFLAINILGEINGWLGQPLLCLQEVRSADAHPFEASERGAEAVISLELDSFSGIITLFAPRDFLTGIDKTQNALLVKKTDLNRLGDFEKIVPQLEMRLPVGTTYLDGDSLFFLEPNDVVLIEQPEPGWQDGSFSENLQVSVGSGRNFRLKGFSAQTETDDYENELTFQIEEILSEEKRRELAPARLKMEEKENEPGETEDASLNDVSAEAEESAAADEDAEQTAQESFATDADEKIAPALENVQVTLRVEISGNKLSLRELQNLRAGQVIGLGCRPTDPVRLVTDANEEPIAIGELVEIEGQLGVRLTKIFI